MKRSVPLMSLVVVASWLLAGAAPPPLPYNDLEEFREFVGQVKEKIIVERSYQIEAGEELTLGLGQAAHLNFAENPAGVAEFLFFYDASAVHIIYRCTDDLEDEYSSTPLHAGTWNDFRSIFATEAQTCLKCFTEWEPRDGKALVRFRTELFSEAEQKAFLKQRQAQRESEKHMNAVREQARAVREWDFAEEVEPFEMVMDDPNDPNMIKLRTKYGLEGLVRSAADEYERLRLILAWVHRQWQHDGSNAASKNDPLTILQEVSEGRRFRCVEFAYVMAGCARSLGMPARVLSLKRPDVETAESGAGHVVAEVWLRQFGKWVFVDGQWGAIPERTGVPLNSVEFQDAIARQKSGLRICFVAQGNEEEYIEWIVPYLYYLDFRPAHRFYPKPGWQLAPAQGMIMLVPKGAAKPKVFQRSRPIENCTYISNPKAFYPQMNDGRPPAGKDQSGEDEPRPGTTRAYQFNTDVKLTLAKGSEIHLDCPDNPHGITEYVLYYRATNSEEELVGIRAVFTDNRCTECGIRREAWEGILQQARYTACLGIMKWQLHDGRLDVDFCATDDLERCRREYRQFRLKGKRYMTQYQDRQLVCPVELPEVQRLAGFAHFWSEVKFNFPFFDKVPEVNWDQVLIDYLPQVQQAKTDVEYYRVLMRCVALLKDNHTSVWGATDEAPCRPPIEIRAVEGKAVVVRVYPADSIKVPELKAELLAAGLKPGEEITHIDGRPVPEILAEDIYPYIAASTPQGLDLDAFPKLAKGENGTRLRLRIRDLQGEERDVALTRGYYDFPEDKEPFLRELEGGIVCVNLDSFGSDRVVRQFEEVFDKVLTAQGLILDVRHNGGGNSGYGDAILSTLIERPARGFRWKTRQYLPAFRPAGDPEIWFECDSGTVQPSRGKHYQGPVVVLTGPATGSAAEDFVVVFQGSGRGKVVGQRTNGSTGQILTLDLPGGGGFRVCTKWCSHPDGREFVGIGVVPDIEVNPTRREIAEGRDAVLETALQVLRVQKP